MHSHFDPQKHAVKLPLILCDRGRQALRLGYKYLLTYLLRMSDR
jgi:hypothetical protein